MKIKVTGRGVSLSMKGKEAENKLFATHNIISINTEGVEDIPFNEDFSGQRNVLILFFDDAIQADLMNQDKMFSARHARAVLEFMKKVDRNRPLIIHCTAGISRSGAVGQV